MKQKITILLSTILTIIMTLLIPYSAITNSITEKSIKTSIKENLLTGLIYDKNGNKTDIFHTIVKLTGLDEETVEKLMKNDTANKIITDIVNSIYDYKLTNDENVKYKENDIINIVNNNIDKVLSEIDYNISKKEREEVIEYTKNNAKSIINTIYSTNIGDDTN